MGQGDRSAPIAMGLPQGARELELGLALVEAGSTAVGAEHECGFEADGGLGRPAGEKLAQAQADPALGPCHLELGAGQPAIQGERLAEDRERTLGVTERLVGPAELAEDRRSVTWVAGVWALPARPLEVLDGLARSLEGEPDLGQVDQQRAEIGVVPPLDPLADAERGDQGTLTQPDRAGRELLAGEVVEAPGDRQRVFAEDRAPDGQRSLDRRDGGGVIALAAARGSEDH